VRLSQSDAIIGSSIAYIKVKIRAPAVGEYTIRFVLRGPIDDYAIQTHVVTVMAS
jgi:hypothetical protein